MFKSRSPFICLHQDPDSGRLTVTAPRLAPAESVSHTVDDEIQLLAEETIRQYSLNLDQSEVNLIIFSAYFSLQLIYRCSRWIPGQPGVELVHGVFGSGKSYLLVVLVLFLCRVNELRNGDMRILISAGTNVAVDRTQIVTTPHVANFRCTCWFVADEFHRLCPRWFAAKNSQVHSRLFHPSRVLAWSRWRIE